MFANPGSTEVPFLAGLPDDIRFVLGLHETAVVGLASGLAIGSGRPALVLLHTTAGLGTGVSALATARVNRAPLVVVVGQQDRRHLAYEPFLAGKLAGLGGEYPVRVEQPARAQDVPAAVERAFHAAETKRGPALVIVPMDDWDEPADEEREPAAAFGPVLRAAAADPEAVDALASFLAEAKSPALVVGAGADDPETWAALVELAERLVAVPCSRSRSEAAPASRRTTGCFAEFCRRRGRGCASGWSRTTRSSSSARRRSVRRRTCRVASPLRERGSRCSATIPTSCTGARPSWRCSLRRRRSAVSSRAVCPHATPRRRSRFARRRRRRRRRPGEALSASHVLAALAERLPRDAVVVEEAPVDRPEIHARLPAREPLGYLSAAQGGLGFAMPAAAGVRMACPRRPVVAVVGDGSAIYGVPVVWSAAHYGIGALFVVLSNERYAVMDRLVERHGGTGPWPAFAEVELATIARGFGCPRRADHDARRAALVAGRSRADARGSRRAAGARRPRRRRRSTSPLTADLQRRVAMENDSHDRQQSAGHGVIVDRAGSSTNALRKEQR